MLAAASANEPVCGAVHNREPQILCGAIPLGQHTPHVWAHADAGKAVDRSTSKRSDKLAHSRVDNSAHGNADSSVHGKPVKGPSTRDLAKALKQQPSLGGRSSGGSRRSILGLPKMLANSLRGTSSGKDSVSVRAAGQGQRECARLMGTSSGKDSVSVRAAGSWGSMSARAVGSVVGRARWSSGRCRAALAPKCLRASRAVWLCCAEVHRRWHERDAGAHRCRGGVGSRDLMGRGLHADALGVSVQRGFPCALRERGGAGGMGLVRPTWPDCTVDSL